MKPEVLEEQSASFKVEEILKYVMYSPGENVMAMGKMPRDAKIVQGLTRMYGFHPVRLSEKRSEIVELIEKICDDGFIVDRGGGQSFLRLAVDREGTQWTSFHLVIEAFLVLSIGLELAGFCAPYEMWHMFPEGIPYVWFRTSEEQEVGFIELPGGPAD